MQSDPEAPDAPRVEESRVAEKRSAKDPVIIKKYANRRLYNTETSSYVTLDYLAQMVKDGRDFVVTDAKTGDDITRAVLAQIIFEEESKGETLLPLNFLRQLISLYGEGLNSMLPGYLEATMEMFTRNQDQYRQYMQDQLKAPAKAFTSSFEEMARQNMAAFERATRMFSPFAFGSNEGAPAAAGDKEKPQSQSQSRPQPQPRGDELQELKDQLRAMQDKIEALSKREG